MVRFIRKFLSTCFFIVVASAGRGMDNCDLDVEGHGKKEIIENSPPPPSPPPPPCVVPMTQ